MFARHSSVSSVTKNSKFLKSISEKKLGSMIQTTIKNGVRLSNTKGRKGYIYIYDFKQTIGKTYNGKPTSRLKVVVIDGKVKTCYPY